MDELLGVFVISHHSRVNGSVLFHLWVHILPFSWTEACREGLLSIKEVIKSFDSKLLLSLALLLLLFLLLHELFLLFTHLKIATTRLVLLMLLVFLLR